MGQAQYQQRRRRQQQQQQQQQQRRAYNNIASVTNHLLTVFENYSKNLIFYNSIAAMLKLSEFSRLLVLICQN